MRKQRVLVNLLVLSGSLVLAGCDDKATVRGSPPAPAVGVRTLGACSTN